MVISKAGPAEILRASQKDEFYTKKLQEMINDLTLQFGGAKFIMKYKFLTESFGKLLYHGATILSGYQTLGEEYTGILQTGPTLRSIPSFFSRLAMVALDCYGAKTIVFILDQLINSIESNVNFRPEAKEQIVTIIKIIKSSIPYIDLLHKALFYCNWGTYHISKRLTRIHYILVRFWLKDRQSLYGFRLLGYVTLIHLALILIHSSYTFIKKPFIKTLSNEFSDSSLIKNKKTTKEHCSLCFESMEQPSLTPCGHLYCWNCILEWLKQQQYCPICREICLPSRIIPLQNFY